MPHPHAEVSRSPQSPLSPLSSLAVKLCSASSYLHVDLNAPPVVKEATFSSKTEREDACAQQTRAEEQEGHLCHGTHTEMSVTLGGESEQRDFTE